MEDNIKVIGKIIKCMVKVYLHGEMVASMWVNIQKTSKIYNLFMKKIKVQLKIKNYLKRKIKN